MVILVSYLLGSIPFSHLFSKLKGQDLRFRGTKNVGATNALVVAGPLAGALALIGDIAKGYLVVQLARLLQLNDWGVAFCAFAVILGHDFSIFLKFKGGKGVATTGGVLMAIDPILWFIVLLLWILMILITRYFILSTLVIMAVLPMVMWLLGKGIEYAILFILTFALALYTHREDLKRLFSGKERKTTEAIEHYFA